MRRSILLIILFLFTVKSHAQFINVEVDINPELKTFVISQLTFPEVVTNSGSYSVELGDPSMGVFGITSYSKQSINIEVRKPEYLTSQFDESQDIIPIEINSFYNNRGEDNYNNALLFTSTSVSVLDNEIQQDNYWETLFIYITGTIDVGNVSVGSYLGEIELIVDYE